MDPMLKNNSLIASLFLVLVWSLAIAATGLYGLFRFNLTPDNAYTWMNADFLNAGKNILPTLSQWDGFWYIDLAKNGYVFKQDELNNTAFLPLYPFLLRITSTVTRSYTLAGVLINIFSLTLAVHYLKKLSALEKFDNSTIQKTVLMILLYPTAIFFLAIYTEALFLCLTVITFYCVKKKRYLWAGIFGMLSALTRIPGVFLFFPFIYYLWKEKEAVGKYVYSLLVPLGTGVYLLLQKFFTGNAFAFLETQKSWGRTIGEINADHFEWASHAATVNGTMDILFAILLVAGVYLVYRKLDLGYAIFCLLALAVPLLTGTTMSIIRFGMVLFPIGMSVAKIKQENVYYVWMFFSIVFLTLYTTQFVHGYWAG